MSLQWHDRRPVPELTVAPIADAAAAPLTSTDMQLNQGNVHAGYNGRIMSLSIAGVQFWQQLGLSPLGGQKHLEVSVICSDEPGAKRAAEELGARFCEATRSGRSPP